MFIIERHDKALEEVKEIVGEEDYLKLTSYLVMRNLVAYDFEIEQKLTSLIYEIVHKHVLPTKLFIELKKYLALGTYDVVVRL